MFIVFDIGPLVLYCPCSRCLVLEVLECHITMEFGLLIWSWTILLDELSFEVKLGLRSTLKQLYAEFGLHRRKCNSVLLKKSLQGKVQNVEKTLQSWNFFLVLEFNYCISRQISQSLAYFLFHNSIRVWLISHTVISKRTRIFCSLRIHSRCVLILVPQGTV